MRQTTSNKVLFVFIKYTNIVPVETTEISEECQIVTTNQKLKLPVYGESANATTTLKERGNEYN